ncbi:MAG: RdgB/HAM1 family non-canonical purine NTP pyrophosphatase [Myxococcota bacterium]|nr:RdgB/HAM1 family non-canonical purine NTP pyrophosphatase [Myxococcota bacterium]
MSAERPEVVLASGNPGKLREVRAILAALPIRLVGLEACPGVVMPEEGDDYEANAVAKARTAAQTSGRVALGDDSGLEVDALGGAPGPRSARYGGPGLDDAGRTARLLAELEGVPTAQRGARFVCVAALAAPDGRVAVARGECVGRIAEAPSGAGGFGYDPVFQIEAHGCTMAELPAAAKHAISHRGHAFRALADELLAVLG